MSLRRKCEKCVRPEARSVLVHNLETMRCRKRRYLMNMYPVASACIPYHTRATSMGVFGKSESRPGSDCNATTVLSFASWCGINYHTTYCMYLEKLHIFPGWPAQIIVGQLIDSRIKRVHPSREITELRNLELELDTRK